MTELYRKRLIPQECIRLDKDLILYRDERLLITRWDTLRPKKNFTWGISCYVLDKGYKISKFFREDNTLAYIYCDIINVEYDAAKDAYIFTDLLADVIIENNTVRVVDLDELAEALDEGLLSPELLSMALRRLDALLFIVHSDDFRLYLDKIDAYVQ